MLDIVRQKKREIAEICQRHGVMRLELFGSASTRSPDSAPADIDFLVFFPKGHNPGPWMSDIFSLESALSDTLGHPVDVVLENALENRWFRREANKTRQVIYDASQVAEVA